jgi:hypothetical protein
MVAAAHLRGEFVRWIHGRIDLSPRGFLRWLQRVYDVREGNVSDDEQVDVAASPQCVLRRRAEHEREHDAIRYAAQSVSQHLDDTGRLHDQALQLAVDRRVSIRFEVHLVASGRTIHELSAVQ